MFDVVEAGEGLVEISIEGVCGGGRQFDREACRSGDRRHLDKGFKVYDV